MGRLKHIDPKMRRCIGPGCYKWFMSSGPGHRFCRKCKIVRDSVSFVAITRGRLRATRAERLAIGIDV